MLKKEFKIKGLTPLAFSKPVEDEKVPKTDEQKLQIALGRVYQHEGKLFIPKKIIKGVIKGGISISKMKIEKSNKRAMDLIGPLVHPEPDEIPLVDDKGKIITIESIKIKTKPTKTDMGKMIWTKFAFIELPWNLNFTIAIGGDLEVSFIKEALINGGLLCSIGGQRPDYGKFEVID